MKTSVWLILLALLVAVIAACWYQRAQGLRAAPTSSMASTMTSDRAAAESPRTLARRDAASRFESEADGSSAKAGEDPLNLAQEIRDRLLAGDEAGHDAVVTNLLARLVALDAAAAGRLAASLEPGRDRQDLLRGVAQAWTDKDPAAAIAWAAALPDLPERATTLSDAAFETAKTAPATAIELAGQYHLDEGSRDILPALATQWASQDLPASLAWAQDQPAGAQHDQIIARIAFVEAQSAPVEAGALVLAAIPPGTAQDEAVMTVLHQWSLQDMAGADAWVQEFPPGALKDRALAELGAVANAGRLAAAQ